MVIASKVRSVVAFARDALEKGEQVIIGLQTTGEAALVRELEEAALLDPGGAEASSRPRLVSMAASILSSAIAKLPKGGVGSAAAAHAISEAELLDSQLPPAALDHLVDELGGSTAVAEMTGRALRMVRAPHGGFVAEKRNAGAGGGMDAQNVRERDFFQNGRKRIAIISEAASTGVSLHADMRCASSSRRRAHLTLEVRPVSVSSVLLESKKNGLGSLASSVSHRL